MTTQIVFMIKEIPQMVDAGFRDYILDWWNIMDIVHFLFFVIIYQLAFFLTQTHYSEWRHVSHSALNDSITFRILCFIELLTMMLKMNYLMRVFIGMGKIVELVSKVFKNSFQFLLFFFLWMIVQTVMAMIIGTEVDDQGHHLNWSAEYFIYFFQNSLGELSVPQYQRWTDLKDTQPKTAMFMIAFVWILWLTIIVFNVVILLNFLITFISQTYN